MLRLAYCVLFYTVLISPAKAFMVEPFLGYGTGSLDVTATTLIPAATVSDSFDLKGLQYGLRAAFEPGRFQLGAEYLLSDYKTSGGTLAKDGEKFKTEELAAFLGFRFWFMRLYAALIVSAKDKDSDLSGEGFKAGLSFYAFKNLALNLEYRTVELNGTEETVLINSDYNVLAFMVSFPFQLF